MFSNRVIKKGDNMQYTSYNKRIVQEHKRNTLILNDILVIVDIVNIKHHMKVLNKQVKHIHYRLFINFPYIFYYSKVPKLKIKHSSCNSSYIFI